MTVKWSKLWVQRPWCHQPISRLSLSEILSLCCLFHWESVVRISSWIKQNHHQRTANTHMKKSLGRGLAWRVLITGTSTGSPGRDPTPSLLQSSHWIVMSGGHLLGWHLDRCHAKWRSQKGKVMEWNLSPSGSWASPGVWPGALFQPLPSGMTWADRRDERTPVLWEA